jgi:hypothetical protein
MFYECKLFDVLSASFRRRKTLVYVKSFYQVHALKSSMILIVLNEVVSTEEVIQRQMIQKIIT